MIFDAHQKRSISVLMLQKLCPNSITIWVWKVELSEFVVSEALTQYDYRNLQEERAYLWQHTPLSNFEICFSSYKKAFFIFVLFPQLEHHFLMVESLHTKLESFATVRQTFQMQAASNRNENAHKNF